MKNRVCIFIDGSNFYHRALKNLGIKESGFDFEKFVDFLIDGRKLNKECKRFYAGSIPKISENDGLDKARSNQTSFFTYLDKNGWVVKTSPLKKRIEELKIDGRVIDSEKMLKLKIDKIKYQRLREKGIDVKLATDLIVGAVDDKYDIAIIVSSDMDLIPAIDWVRLRMKKEVEYIGFSVADSKNKSNSTTPILAMITSTDSQRVLSEIDIKKFKKM